MKIPKRSTAAAAATNCSQPSVATTNTQLRKEQQQLRSEWCRRSSIGFECNRARGLQNQTKRDVERRKWNAKSKNAKNQNKALDRARQQQQARTHTHFYMDALLNWKIGQTAERQHIALACSLSLARSLSNAKQCKERRLCVCVCVREFALSSIA